MYRTKEIRWFFKEEREQLVRCFKQLDNVSSHTRTDFYLDLNNEDIGVKLREGKIEIKHRIGTRAYGGLNDNAWGCFDDFIKWSFDVQEQDSVLSKIVDFQHREWIPVQKEQKLLQLTKENGTIKTKSITEQLDYGCQVEYAAITVREEEWHTFALEWFGEHFLELEGEIISEIMDSIKLHINDSFGYASFLTKLSHTKNPNRSLEKDGYNSESIG